MFRKRRGAKQLTADELKSKLYSHFDKTGSLTQMRTELRGKLVTELLKRTAPLKPVVDETIADFDKTLLPMQVCNWLVYDHLLRQGYQYALSTFVTEANLPPPEKLLTACDILSLFGLDNTTQEYKNISKMYSADNQQGYLHSLLLAVIKSLFDFSSSVEKNINKNFDDKDPKDFSSEQLSEKFSPKRFLHSESNRKIPFQEETFISESSKFRGHRVNPDDVSFQRNKSAESSLHEQLQFVKEEKEREVQMLRHKLLQELDRLHAQERKLQLDIEHERSELNKEHDVLLAEKDKLKEKELIMSKEHENKLERRIREMETDFISKIHSKEKDLENSQQKLREKEQRLLQVDADFSNQHYSYGVLKKELEDMRNIYSSIQEKYAALLDDNTNLLKKFESMSDYTILRGDLEAKSNQAVKLQREMEDICQSSEKEKNKLIENMSNLEKKLKIKESELLEAQRQLNVTRDTLHMEETVWGKERRKLEQDTLASRDMYKTLIQRIEEQKEDIQALHHTIHILHYQLTDKDARSFTKPEPIIPHRTAFRMSAVSRSDPDVFRINRNFRDSPPKYKESSLKFIEEAKDRISKLQKEAETLQDKCSIIYGSAPGFHGIPSSSFSTNPQSFNATNARLQSTASHMVKSFPNHLHDNHFENLIRNEMPTLDLSLPLQIKSQFVNTFKDMYAPETLSTTPTSTNIVSMFCPSNGATNDMIGKSGELNKKVVASPEFDQQLRNTPERKENHQINNDGVKSTLSDFLHSKDGLTPRLKEFTHNMTEYTHNITSIDLSDSTYISHNPSMPLKTVESDKLQEISTPNLQCTLEEVPTATTEDVRKASDGLLLSISKPKEEASQTGSLPVIGQEESVSSLDIAPTIQSDRVKQDSVQQFGKDSESVLETQIVVDLDAAWKRKTSLVPLSYTPIQSTSLLRLSNLSQNVEDKNNSNTINIEVSQTGTNLREMSTKELLDSSEVKSAADVNLIPTDSSQKVQNLELELDSRNLNSAEQKTSTLHNFKTTDNALRSTEPEMTMDADSHPKPIHEESLSELSEIHLSCGSEQEQQKDDSDNW